MLGCFGTSYSLSPSPPLTPSIRVFRGFFSQQSIESVGDQVFAEMSDSSACHSPKSASLKNEIRERDSRTSCRISVGGPMEEDGDISRRSARGASIYIESTRDCRNGAIELG